MLSRRKFFQVGAGSLASMLIGSKVNAMEHISEVLGVTDKYVSGRPPVDKRCFKSETIEKAIAATKKKIKDPKLAWMFENCFPNTLDTTCEYTVVDGKPDTFVITGDIHAMWLRDSSAQVFPYVAFAAKDKELQSMLRGVINRQTESIIIDPYANAFNLEATGSEWESDNTVMKPELHERKWEIDSLCYPVRLAYNYWKKTGDKTPFDANWQKAMGEIYKTFVEQQRKDNLGPYKFTRVTDRQADTLLNFGVGSPVNPVGMIVSSFRPSDDATIFGFLIPSNLFAVVSLRQMAEMLKTLRNDTALANKCTALADEVEAAVQKYGVVEHPKYGKMYAFEVDGFGGQVLMDDANVPSLIALPYLGCVKQNDPIYQNTRKFILSSDNPYFFKGTAAEGVGSPHTGLGFIWPMSIIMRANTTDNKEEIAHCVEMLKNCDGETGFMHESFDKDNPKQFSRSWFAWSNTLFGELLYNIYNN